MYQPIDYTCLICKCMFESWVDVNSNNKQTTHKCPKCGGEAKRNEIQAIKYPIHSSWGVNK